MQKDFSPRMSLNLRSPLTFEPPNGLKLNEQVVWSRRSGPFLGGTGLGRTFLAFGVLFFGVGLFPVVTSCSSPATASCDWFSTISVGPGLILAGLGSLILWENKGPRGDTRYYLTNYRLVETRGGRVVGQVPTALFKGVPVDQYLTKESTYESDNGTVYNISLLDPQSGETLMRLTDMPRESLESLAALTRNR